jgi:hypothetical protein
MKRTSLLLIAGAVAGVMVLALGAASSGPAPGSSEIEQLKKEVAALRQRVELLEERLKEDLVPASIKDGKGTPGIINPYQGLRQTPSNWKRFEFNGMPYYICPIETAGLPAREDPKPVSPSDGPTTPQPPGNR